MPPVKLYIPHSISSAIFVPFVLVMGQANLTSTKSKGKISLSITMLANASKIFSPARLGGNDVLRKRHYGKVKENGIFCNKTKKLLLWVNRPQ